MSNIYVSEPPTKGKVVINTTHGPLDIELWPKEAPKAVRNFVQLCLEGYYDNNIFHRIIKEFLVQGGDPTGTGKGGESIYGGSFSDEFHTRLRFSHRGIVACANAGTPHSNGSQFFISLARCDWLDRKNTIFGKVTGDSLYNLVNIGELETDENDRPVDPPPKITSIEVIWNPFEDIVPRVVVSKSLAGSTLDAENKNEKKKGVKKLSLLSFGDEAEEEEKELATVKQQKIKSSHDVLNDPRLLKAEDSVQELDSSEIEAARNRQLSVREALSLKKEELPKNLGLENSNSIDNSDDDEINFDARMRQKILTRRKEQGDVPPKKKPHHCNPSTNDNIVSASRSNAESSDDDKPKKKLYIKKKGIGSDARAERMAKGDTDLQLLGEAERGRHLQKQKQRRLQGREDDVLARLAKFKQTLSGEPTATQSVPEGDGDGNDWKYVQLKFAPDSVKNGMTRNEDPNDYVVHDPLLEKGKEKFNKMQAKQKRREREWAGKSIT